MLLRRLKGLWELLRIDTLEIYVENFKADPTAVVDKQNAKATFQQSSNR